LEKDKRSFEDAKENGRSERGRDLVAHRSEESVIEMRLDGVGIDTTADKWRECSTLSSIPGA
jgi:hypothetical protein